MKARVVLCALAGAFLVSCNPLLTGSLPAGMASSAVVQNVPYSGSFQYTVDPQGIARDVYFVFTNPSLTQDASSTPTVSSSIVVNGKTIPGPASQPLSAVNSTPQTFADYVSEFNRNPRAYLPAPSFLGPSLSTSYVSTLSAQNDVAGSTTGIFYTNLNSNGTGAGPVTATCEAVNGPVTFSDGRKRTVSVWVDNSDFGIGKDITSQTAVKTLASQFLKAPAESQSDIYHWDTSVVGEPWGPNNDPSMIQWDPNATVTILLTHLNSGTYPPSGAVTVGFFWAKDNFTTTALPGSNQRIMFYIDSYMYANYPSLVYSTLAHEFQHMIQFYQKQVVLGASVGTDTWINEMCSMLMEDLVAYNLQVEGPRGVLLWSDGSASTPSGVDNSDRIAAFNQYSNTSLAVTGSNFGLTQYAVAYAFGAWLIRNYGGPQLLTRIVQCPQTDYTAVVNAASAFSGKTETMQSLLERWAAAVLISDDTGAPFGYRYNTGNWTTFTAGSQSFNLGSLNVFNYSPTLTVFSSSAPIPAAPYYSSNVYFKAATALSAATTFSVTLPAGTVMSVVLK